MYDTTDRKRGPKGNKRNITRNVSRYGYGNKNFCTLTCYNDWASEHMDRAIDYIGRLREPKAMTPENSWDKRQRSRWQMDNGEERKKLKDNKRTRQITRKAQWTDKCRIVRDKISDKIRYMTYYDLSQQGYRCATGQIWITSGLQ